MIIKVMMIVFGTFVLLASASVQYLSPTKIKLLLYYYYNCLVCLMYTVLLFYIRDRNLMTC